MASGDGIEIFEVAHNRSGLCRDVLTSLPRWFGILESLEVYVRDVATLPMLAATAAGTPIGFISLKDQSPFATEAFVLGVKPEWHRKGVGRRLFEHAANDLRKRGVRFLTVKTVAAADRDPVYGATRLFYEAVGFVPVETFPTLWQAENPCLFMIKPLGRT